MRLEEKFFEKYKNCKLYGRIKSYSKKKGFGWIMTELGQDVFLSSYSIKDKKIAIGTIVKFTPVEKTTGEMGGYAAADIEVVDNSCVYNDYYMPNGKKIRWRSVERFGYVKGDKVLDKLNISKDDLINHGYDEDSLSYAFIRLQNGDEYKFFGKTSPVRGDGRIEDPESFCACLNRQYCFL